ncbi:MAG: TldD/PmbA family protein [Acidobacteriia bacterium]|nr:TldD/PmbA family protein [Terriglobia bacterium]
MVKKILSFSTFPECTVSINESEQSFVRFANNGVTTAGLTTGRTIRVSSTRETKTGTAETSEIDEASLRAVVARSEQIAAIAPPSAEHVPPLGEQQYPRLPAMDPETAAARSPTMVPHVRAVIDAAVARKLIAAGFFERATSASILANKQGLFGYHRSADAGMSTTIRNSDGTSSGWAGQPSARILEINGAALAETAIQKCLRWKSPRKLEPGKYTVVLEPTAVNDLLGMLGFSFSARNAEEGRSFLSKKGGGTQLGEKLFPESVSLFTDPFDQRNPGSPWDASGLPTARIPWIENGVVRNLFYDRYWASKTGKSPTPSPNSLHLRGGNSSIEDLIAATERGLIVTRFWYIRPVNMQTLQLTGLTRDGLFLIENGKITDPVMNLRFNESPVRMLQNVLQLGRVTHCRGGEGDGMLIPGLQAAGFTFSSISDAV